MLGLIKPTFDLPGVSIFWPAALLEGVDRPLPPWIRPWSYTGER